jgi:hypothetical protein
LGVLEPIGVAREGDVWRLVYGERRLKSCLSLGWTHIPAVVITDNLLQAEHDENERRKDLTVSEKVAIGEEIERRLGRRQGKRTDLQLGAKRHKVRGSRTEVIAAKAAGFNSQTTYRKAKEVVNSGDDGLIRKVDAGDVSINAAFGVVEGRKARKVKGDMNSPVDREDHALYSDATRRAGLIAGYLDKVRYHLKQSSKSALENLPGKVLDRFAADDVEVLFDFLGRLVERQRGRFTALRLVPQAREEEARHE